MSSEDLRGKPQDGWREVLNYTLAQLGLDLNSPGILTWLSQNVGITRTFVWQILEGRSHPNPQQAKRIIEACFSQMEDKKERLPVSVSAAVLIENPESQVLLVQQRTGKWGLPAGGMRFGETPIHAALREAKEEIGIQPKLTGIIGIYTSYTTIRPGLGFVFKGEIPASYQVKKSNSPEITEAKYFSVDEIVKLVGSNQIYRPDFNLPAIRDWGLEKVYPLESVSSQIPNYPCSL